METVVESSHERSYIYSTGDNIGGVLLSMVFGSQMIVPQAPDADHGIVFPARFRCYFDPIFPCYTPFLSVGMEMFTLCLCTLEVCILFSEIIETHVKTLPCISEPLGF